MRQAGVLAAAGIYALQNNIHRLEEDHQNARRLAEGLMRVSPLKVKGGGAHTNMVFVEIDKDQSEKLGAHLASQDILVGSAPTMRLVTHLDIDPADIERFVGEVNEFFERAA
jgi:threonine aldolase